jgi:hypothetical protein
VRVLRISTQEGNTGPIAIPRFSPGVRYHICCPDLNFGARFFLTSGIRPGMTTNRDHVTKRETPWGLWMPVAFYSLNFALWLATGIAFGAGDLLYLAVAPLPALAAYFWRTRQ